MNIKLSQLKSIIKEEVSKVLSERLSDEAPVCKFCNSPDTVLGPSEAGQETWTCNDCGETSSAPKTSYGRGLERSKPGLCNRREVRNIPGTGGVTVHCNKPKGHKGHCGRV